MESYNYVLRFRLYHVIFECNPLHLLTLQQISFYKKTYSQKNWNDNIAHNCKSICYGISNSTT